MDNKENENHKLDNLDEDKLEINNLVEDKKTDELDITKNMLLNTDKAVTDLTNTTEPIINNRFFRFMDKYCFLITTLVGCFYMISCIFVMITYAYSTNPFATLLYYIYVGFFFLHIVFWTGLSCYYKNIKYFGHLLLGFFIGLFTCGGFYIFLVNM